MIFFLKLKRLAKIYETEKLRTRNSSPQSALPKSFYMTPIFCESNSRLLAFFAKQMTLQGPQYASQKLSSRRVLRRNFSKKETLAQVFSCKFCEISKNTFLHRTPVAASGLQKVCFLRSFVCLLLLIIFYSGFLFINIFSKVFMKKAF